MSEERHSEGALPRGTRALVVAAAIVLAAAAGAHRLAWNAAHREALELLAASGLPARQPAVAADVATDPDPVRSRLAVARGLVAEAYDPNAFSMLSAREAADAASRLSERLEVARRVASEALAELPAAWQAAMIVGSATNRIWSLAGDPRLFGERATWETPLRVAARLAPGQDEPLRPLAIAWLETWPLLPAERRVEARAAVHRAFSDPDTFRQCAVMWLSAAADRNEAFSLVPDQPWGWAIVGDACRVREDWEGFCAARSLGDLAIGASARRRVGEATLRLRGGDPSGARALALGVVADLPADRRFAGILESALACCPPGPVTVPIAALRRWLDLALDGCVRGQSWLAPGAVARLAASAGDLPTQKVALAALAGNDLTWAEVVERRAEAGVTEPWALYWVAKARVLARDGRVTDGRAALRRVNRAFASSLPALGARLALAEASGDAAAVTAARADLDIAAAASWRGTDWVWRGQVARLDINAARDASGFVLRLDEFPPRGTVVQVTLDGAPITVAPAVEHEGLDITAPVSRGPHLVEITTIAGGRVVPGELTLR